MNLEIQLTQMKGLERLVADPMGPLDGPVEGGLSVSYSEFGFEIVASIILVF
jgi:hypothetical protein